MRLVGHHKHQLEVVESEGHVEELIDVHEKHEILESVFYLIPICRERVQTADLLHIHASSL